MKVKQVAAAGQCQVVVAEFVWGAQFCRETTHFVEQETGDDFYVCREHIEAVR